MGRHQAALQGLGEADDPWTAPCQILQQRRAVSCFHTGLPRGLLPGFLGRLARRLELQERGKIAGYFGCLAVPPVGLILPSRRAVLCSRRLHANLLGQAGGCALMAPQLRHVARPCTVPSRCTECLATAREARRDVRSRDAETNASKGTTACAQER